MILYVCNIGIHTHLQSYTHSFIHSFTHSFTGTSYIIKHLFRPIKDLILMIYFFCLHMWKLVFGRLPHKQIILARLAVPGAPVTSSTR